MLKAVADFAEKNPGTPLFLGTWTFSARSSRAFAARERAAIQARGVAGITLTLSRDKNEKLELTFERHALYELCPELFGNKGAIQVLRSHGVRIPCSLMGLLPQPLPSEESFSRGPVSI